MQNLREGSDRLEAHVTSFSCNRATNESFGASHNGSRADPSMTAPYSSKSTRNSLDVSHDRNQTYTLDDSDSDDFESVGSSSPEFQTRQSSGKNFNEHQQYNINDKAKNRDVNGRYCIRKYGIDDVRLRKNPVITNKGPDNFPRYKFLSPNTPEKVNKTTIEKGLEEESKFDTQESGELQDDHESNTLKVPQHLKSCSHFRSGENIKTDGDHDDDSLKHRRSFKNKAKSNKVNQGRKAGIEFDEGDGGGLPTTKISLNGIQSDSNNKVTRKARRFDCESREARLCDDSNIFTSQDSKNSKDFKALDNNKPLEDTYPEDGVDEFSSNSNKRESSYNKLEVKDCNEPHQSVSHKSKGCKSKNNVYESETGVNLFDKAHPQTSKVTFEKHLSKKNDVKDARTLDEGDGGGYPEDDSFNDNYCGYGDDYYTHGDDKYNINNPLRNTFDYKHREHTRYGNRCGLKYSDEDRCGGNHRHGRQNQSRGMNARLRRESEFQGIHDDDHHHDNHPHGTTRSNSCSCSSINSEESFGRSGLRARHRLKPRCKSSGRKCGQSYSACGTYHRNRQLGCQQNSRCVSPCSSQKSGSQCSSVGNVLSALSVNKPYPAAWRTFGRKPPGIHEFRPLGVGRLANVRPAGKQQYLSRVSDEKGGCHRKGSQSDLWDICYGLAKPVTDEWTTPLPYGTNIVRVGEIDPFFEASRGDIVIINPAQNFYRAMKSGYVMTYHGGQDYSFGVGDLIVRLGRFMPSGKYIPYGNLELYMHTHSREKRLLGRQPHLHVDFNYHNLDYESPGKYLAIGTFLNELLFPRRGDIIISGGAWAENYPNEQRKHHSSVQYWRPNMEFLPNDMLLRPYVDIGRATRHRGFYWGAAELYSYSGKGLAWAYWGRDHHICDTPYPREQEHGIKTGHHKDEVGHCSSR